MGPRGENTESNQRCRKEPKTTREEGVAEKKKFRHGSFSSSWLAVYVIFIQSALVEYRYSLINELLRWFHVAHVIFLHSPFTILPEKEWGGGGRRRRNDRYRTRRRACLIKIVYITPSICRQHSYPHRIYVRCLASKEVFIYSYDTHAICWAEGGEGGLSRSNNSKNTNFPIDSFYHLPQRNGDTNEVKEKYPAIISLLIHLKTFSDFRFV